MLAGSVAGSGSPRLQTQQRYIATAKSSGATAPSRRLSASLRKGRVGPCSPGPSRRRRALHDVLQLVGCRALRRERRLDVRRRNVARGVGLHGLKVCVVLGSVRRDDPRLSRRRVCRQTAGGRRRGVRRRPRVRGVVRRQRARLHDVPHRWLRHGRLRFGERHGWLREEVGFELEVEAVLDHLDGAGQAWSNLTRARGESNLTQARGEARRTVALKVGGRAVVALDEEHRGVKGAEAAPGRVGVAERGVARRGPFAVVVRHDGRRRLRRRRQRLRESADGPGAHHGPREWHEHVEHRAGGRALRDRDEVRHTLDDDFHHLARAGAVRTLDLGRRCPRRTALAPASDGVVRHSLRVARFRGRRPESSLWRASKLCEAAHSRVALRRRRCPELRTRAARG
ncbi:hypothetical protein M885DRAFT_508263 [Pelagophyceae sp. CCMP2097]|nr:hypothetical protein M885DRAFT_508263 [Pelagophyceae sp. CCMP2097]